MSARTVFIAVLVVAAAVGAGCTTPPDSTPLWGPAERVTLGAAGQEIPSADAWYPDPVDLSSDGRFVLFAARGDLVSGPDELNARNAYLRDTLADETLWVRDPTLPPSTQGVWEVLLISGDGSTVIVWGVGLDGGTTDGIYAFDRASESFKLLDPYSVYENNGFITDITDDGRLVVGTTSDHREVRVLDTVAGSVQDVYVPDGRDVASPHFVDNETRIVFSEFHPGYADFFSIALDGSDLREINVGAGVELMWAGVVAAGANCVLINSQNVLGYVERRFVDLTSGASRSFNTSIWVDKPSGTPTAIAEFRPTDIADDCRTVVGVRYSRLAQVDLQLGTIVTIQPVSLLEVDDPLISHDGGTALARSRHALVAEDTNQGNDGYIWRR